MPECSDPYLEMKNEIPIKTNFKCNAEETFHIKEIFIDL